MPALQIKKLRPAGLGCCLAGSKAKIPFWFCSSTGFLSLAQRCSSAAVGVRACACTRACAETHPHCNTCMHSRAYFMCICDSGVLLSHACGCADLTPVHQRTCAQTPVYTCFHGSALHAHLGPPLTPGALAGFALCFLIQRPGSYSSRPRFSHPTVRCTPSCRLLPHFGSPAPMSLQSTHLTL